MAAAAEDHKTVLLCVATKGRSEVTLTCAISLLRLQILLMTLPNHRIRADMHFVNSLNDAIDVLHRHPSAEGVLCVESSVGFDPDAMLYLTFRMPEYAVHDFFDFSGLQFTRERPLPLPAKQLYAALAAVFNDAASPL